MSSSVKDLHRGSNSAVGGMGHRRQKTPSGTSIDGGIPGPDWTGAAARMAAEFNHRQPPDGQVAGLREIQVVIEGTTPLLCNRFGDGAQMAATSGTRLAIVGDRGTPLEQATAKLYVGHDGRPMIPQPNLFRCVIDAGKFFKSGKSKVTTQKSSLLPACLEIDGLELPIEHREPWTVDTRAVRIPATGGRVLCHRPCFHDWRIEFTLRADTDLVPLKLLRELVDAAGKRIGLGDFRPDCKGPFGKFVVVHWEEKDGSKSEG